MALAPLEADRLARVRGTLATGRIKGRTRGTMVKIDQTESHVAFHKLLVP
jgi:hypothetical protein